MTRTTRHALTPVAALLLGILMFIPSAIGADAMGGAVKAEPVAAVASDFSAVPLSELESGELESDQGWFEESVFEATGRPGGGQCRPWGRICRMGSNDCCAPLRCRFDGYMAWCRN